MSDRNTMPLRSRSTILAAVCLCTAVLGAIGTIYRAAAQQPQSHPSARGPTEFQPGVRIDWQKRQVLAAGRIVLREGPLELVACFHSKEHESIIKFDCKAQHLFLALGLLGLTPGRPPAWDDANGRYVPATGDLVDIDVESPAGGEMRRCNAFDWLRESEFDRPPIARPFVFAGSKMLAGGVIASDVGGVGIAIVDQAESLFCPSHSHSDRNDDLWAFANTQAIPPVGTPVRLIFSAATPHAHRYRLDFRGAAYADDVFVDADDLADLIRIARRLEPDAIISIDAHEALEIDVARWRAKLRERGIPADAIRFLEE